MTEAPMIDKLRSEIELFGRHIEIARAVRDHQPIGITKLAELLGLPVHRVRYSLRVLEQDGYISASPAGAVATGRTEALLGTLDQDLDDLVAILSSIRR